MDRNSRNVEWSHLSALDEKRDAYALDPYFRECLWDARVELGERLFAVLHRLTLLVFKPEAFVGRRTGAAMRFLAENGFTPLLFHEFSFTRLISREVWRYQWNAATLDKMDVSTLSFGESPSLLLILRDDSKPGELPATVRLKLLKGAAAPEARSSKALRSVLAAPNRMLSFVHTSDEPADILRELGIFFDRPVRRSIFRDVLARLPGGGVTTGCMEALKQLESAAPANNFDPNAAWRRILGRADAQTREALLEQHELFERTGRIDWESFRQTCAGLGCDDWDLISIGTAAIDYEDAGQVQLIHFDRGGLEGWLSGKARLVREGD